MCAVFVGRLCEKCKKDKCRVCIGCSRRGVFVEHGVLSSGVLSNDNFLSFRIMERISRIDFLQKQESFVCSKLSNVKHVEDKKTVVFTR